MQDLCNSGKDVDVAGYVSYFTFFRRVEYQIAYGPLAAQGIRKEFTKTPKFPRITQPCRVIVSILVQAKKSELRSGLKCTETW